MADRPIIAYPPIQQKIKLELPDLNKQVNDDEEENWQIQVNYLLNWFILLIEITLTNYRSPKTWSNLLAKLVALLLTSILPIDLFPPKVCITHYKLFLKTNVNVKPKMNIFWFLTF